MREELLTAQAQTLRLVREKGIGECAAAHGLSASSPGDLEIAAEDAKDRSPAEDHPNLELFCKGQDPGAGAALADENAFPFGDGIALVVFSCGQYELLLSGLMDPDDGGAEGDRVR